MALGSSSEMFELARGSKEFDEDDDEDENEDEDED